MKTADEMRKRSLSAVNDMIADIEQQIESSAGEGNTRCVVWIDMEKLGVWCGSKMNAIVDELKYAGYDVETENVYDQRDGNYVKFNIEW